VLQYVASEQRGGVFLAIIGVLQVYCSILYCAAVCCKVLHCVAACYSVLQSVGRQRIAWLMCIQTCFNWLCFGNVFQFVVVCCSVMQCVVVGLLMSGAWLDFFARYSFRCGVTFGVSYVLCVCAATMNMVRFDWSLCKRAVCTMCCYVLQQALV